MLTGIAYFNLILNVLVHLQRDRFLHCWTLHRKERLHLEHAVEVREKLKTTSLYVLLSSDESVTYALPSKRHRRSLQVKHLVELTANKAGHNEIEILTGEADLQAL